MSKVFSAIQPTGFLHIGNYLGALKEFSKLQEKYSECFYCVADLHAITINQCPKKLQESILFTLASYLASGVDPEKSTLFIQSHVPEHLELSWILTCNTPLGWLNRMTQFKDKSCEENTMTGLLIYPCLMAADILIYKSNFVPVGNDQTQHLEITCDIAKKFNHDFNCNFLTIPEKITTKHSNRIMSLRDASKKMSKSEISEYSRINLVDSAEEISNKIKKAKTDEFTFPETIENAENRPEINNLINIYSSFIDQDKNLY
ncbi:tryptophan--tRNA ligase-like [Triplophysa rosa]|uniref:tryptophan--tRNA ligase-like n=1 Tax=Triplophysa rosa TaxID=992332 RepID=UPI002545CD2C|nr:tryptophan--tRNA ligase-like [Triplophysa rosa]